MYRTLRPAALMLVSLSASVALAAPKKPAPAAETARYGVYLMNSRIGSMVTKTANSVWEKKPAIKMDALMDVKMAVLGTQAEQKMDVSHVLDRTGKPLYTRMVVQSMGRTTRVEARYQPSKILCNGDAGGQKYTKVVPIPKGIVLVGDPQLAGALEKGIKVGLKTSVHFFEPLTMTIQKVTTEVVKTEKRTVGGKPVRAFLLKSTNSMTGEGQSWVDAEGNLLEEHQQGVGLRLVREDLKAEGTGLAYAPPKDFAVATAVKTAVKLEQPRALKTLKLKISGIPEETLILSDTRQQVLGREKVGERWAATYQMQARELPQTALPVAAAGAAGAGLGDAPYLGSVDPTIRKQAKELADGETDRALIARRIRAWVKGHMQKPNNVGTPRSAPEIMKSRDGVCRDYATLFAGLARAAGVPTRICSGIVYFQDGFFYHAWVECQLTEGEDGWFAFDPTLDDDFVDATHIKFAQGDPSEMFAAVRVVGQIQAEILEHK